MKILVISDTHRDLRNVSVALENESPLDMVIHCGDVCGDEDVIEAMCGCAFYAVAGNMDLGSALPAETVVEAAGHRLFIAHGHRHYVGSGTEELKDAARSCRADIALCGHTHIPLIEETEELTVVNPGSLSYPRQLGKRASYATIKLHGHGMECGIHYL